MKKTEYQEISDISVLPGLDRVLSKSPSPPMTPKSSQAMIAKWFG